MDRAVVLADIDFGSDVAEHDEGLRHYFLPTRTFTDIVKDRHDLILGPKGTGKSAIYRILCGAIRNTRTHRYNHSASLRNRELARKVWTWAGRGNLGWAD